MSNILLFIDNKMRGVKYTYIIFVISIIYSCQGNNMAIAKGLPMATDTVSYEVLGTEDDGKFIIKDTIDLNNCVCIIPENVSLVFRGGYLKNGTLVGNYTKLKSSMPCFSRVRIMGTWNVPVINTTLFDDLSYDNALKDVFALADSSINNKIVIGKGYYQVTAYKNGDICLPIYSKAEMVIDDEIKLTPNDFRNYYIIQASGENIKIHGKGTIIGDKHTHTGESGEWGMGIDVENAHHVLISGLTIKDCWGDCIYVGSESTDVRIENCRLDHGRRQGISITSANGVSIKNCVITNVNGTAPEYAIDIEPNKGERVDNVVVEHVMANRCRGGFLVYGRAKDAWVGKVTFRRCQISADGKVVVNINKCDKANVEKCEAILSRSERVVACNEVTNLILRDNRVRYENPLSEKIKTAVKSAVGMGDNRVMSITNCGNSIVDNNRVVE